MESGRPPCSTPNMIGLAVKTSKVKSSKSGKPLPRIYIEAIAFIAPVLAFRDFLIASALFKEDILHGGLQPTWAKF